MRYAASVVILNQAIPVHAGKLVCHLAPESVDLHATGLFRQARRCDRVEVRTHEDR